MAHKSRNSFSISIETSSYLCVMVVEIKWVLIYRIYKFLYEKKEWASIFKNFQIFMEKKEIYQKILKIEKFLIFLMLQIYIQGYQKGSPGNLGQINGLRPMKCSKLISGKIRYPNKKIFWHFLFLGLRKVICPHLPELIIVLFHWIF